MWLQRLAGVTLRPVLDRSRTDAVDGNDAPVWMRELVMLRDGHCVFPDDPLGDHRTTYEWTSPLHRTYRVTPRPH